jgi:acyl transferase domain-containing protein/thioesterase domain-containing protein/acyl-CoA synthetase (AMP-forming)/AMP-acid ligase II/aryl carrier-like protein/SAM-dependent methyltransferase
MWFMQSMNPLRADLTIGCSAWLTRSMDVEQLQQRLLPVVTANPLLRAVAEESADGPVWRPLRAREAVAAAVQPTLRAGSTSQVREFYTRFITRPWNLDGGLPWRVRLVTAAGATFLFCRFHHLVCDGDRSLELFLDGLDGSHGRDGEAGLELPDLLAEVAQPSGAQAKIDDLTAAIGEAGNLRKRIVDATSDGQRWTGTLDAVVNGGPDEVALLRRLRATTAELVPGESLLVAIPFDGCADGQAEQFGYFGNPGVAVLPTARPDSPWAEREFQRARTLADVPFQHIMADEQFRRVVDPVTPFDILLVPRRLFGYSSGLVQSVSEPAVSRTPYALVLNHWRARDGRLHVRMESTVFDWEVLDHLGSKLISDREEWPAPSPPRGVRAADPDVLVRLAGVADEHPGDTAIDVPGTGSVSYQQLWEHASVLADHLDRNLPAGRRVVAVVGEAHPNEIPCVVGVNLASATVIRLDRGRAATRRTLAALDGVGAVIRLDGARPGEAGTQLSGPFGTYFVDFTAAPAEDAGTEDLYITLTSGSTGQPKPIPFPRAEFNSLISWHLRTFPSPRRMLQFSKLSFDIAYHEIYATLCGGGTLVVGGQEVRDDPHRLLRLIGTAGVEKIYLPTVLLRPIAEAAMAGGVPVPTPALKEVLVAGGSLRITPEIREWFTYTAAMLVNDYGMSETQDVTSHHLTGPPADWPERPPAGLPIDGVEVRVAGANGMPLPPSLAGSVLVRSGGREIDTGDTGYLDRDGQLHILGRDSRIVKQRGFRVNLLALETRTAEASGVAEAAAVHHTTSFGSTVITVVATKHQADAPPDAAAISAATAEALGDGYEHDLFFVPEIPRLANFKPDMLEIAKLAQRLTEAPTAQAERATPSGSAVLDAVRELTGNTEVGERTKFLDAGFDSISLMSLAARLGRDHPGISVADFFRYPVIGELQRRLDQPAAAGSAVTAGRTRRTSDAISVVGMACRVPGAPDVDTFWRNLLDGTSPVSAGYAPDGDMVAAQGQLSDVDVFDHAFFGVTPAEARRMDPQVRVFMQLCWSALEDAGEADDLEGKNVGVFAGAGLSTYLLNELEPRRQAGDGSLFLEHNTLPERLGTDRNYLTSTVSYRLGLTGPSIVVQAACATSLTAVHMARQALLAGECDIALAGGVSIIYPQPDGYEYVDGSVRSRQGVCRPFDSEADGTVFGNGAGVVVLKRAKDAKTGRNFVYADITGSAVNHDGSAKGSFSAPNPRSQTRLIDTALGTSPAGLDFVEAHGTGTAVGDVIEWNAMASSRLTGTDDGSACLVGSVKGNVGHLDEAAGVAGLIKACLAVRHRLFPGTFGFRRLNPHLAASDRFTVSPGNCKLADDRPIRGGVSSFGMGGANCHVVLRSPDTPVTGQDTPLAERSAPLYLPLSARSRESFEGLADRLRTHLIREAAHLTAEDVVSTLTSGRHHFDEHRGVLLRHGDELDVLEAAGERTVWAFPGQGSGFSWPAVAELSGWPVFAEQFGALLDQFARQLGTKVFDGHVGRWTRDPAQPLEPEDSVCGDRCTIREQVLQFSFQLAMARLLRSFGMRPDVVVGHSLGEITAAVCADHLSEQDAVTLVSARSALMDTTSAEGFMAQVGCEVRRASAAAAELDLDIAAVNGPQQVVLAGPRAKADLLPRAKALAGVDITRLPVGKAFHSRMMADAATELVKLELTAEANLPVGEPTIEFVASNAAHTGSLRPVDLMYWVTQLTSAVDFLTAAETVLNSCGRPPLVVEVGFGSTLSHLTRATAKASAAGVPTTVCGLKKSVAGYLGKVAGAAYRAGQPVDWAALNHVSGGTLVPLPSYPFARTEIQPHGTPERTTNVTPDVSFPLCPAGEDWIAGHRVGGRWVVPAAGILQLFAKACRQARPDQAEVRLTDVSFERPVVIETETDVVDARVSLGRNEIVLWTRQAGEEWTRHASAAPAGDLPDIPMPSPVQGQQVDADALYRRFSAQALEYGAGYRGLTAITAGGDAASATWQPPAGASDRSGIGIDSAEVAAVDGILQLMDVSTGDTSGTIRMPAHIAHVCLRPLPGSGTDLNVRVGQPATGVLAEGTDPVVALAGVRLQAQSRVDGIAHRLVWRDHITVGADVPNMVASAISETQAALAAPDDEVTKYQQRVLELENHAVRVLEAAGGRGYAENSGHGLAADRRARAFGKLLDRELLAPDAHEPAAGLDAERSILLNCADSLSQYFDGSLDGESILFSGHGAERLRAYYQSSFLLNRLNTTLARLVASMATAHAPRTIKVLEVGGGTGASTEGILNALDEAGTAVRYTFTDLSEGLTRLADERFGHRPGFATATADLESAESIGALDDDYDVIVAVDVVHATRDVARTVDLLAGRLSPGGALLLVEDLKALAWVDLTFGLLDSWWSYDDDVRADHPLLGQDQWRNLLADRFGHVDVLRACASLATEDTVADEGLFVCHNPGRTRTQPVLVDVVSDADVEGLVSDAAGTLVLRFGRDELDADDAERYASTLLQAVRGAEKNPALENLVFCTPGGAGELLAAGSMAAALARVATAEDRRVKTYSLATETHDTDETVRQVETMLTHCGHAVNARIANGTLRLPYVQPSEPALAPDTLDHDAVVVFGGQSDLAHAVAERLTTACGIGQVWLAGRSEPGDQTQQLLETLRGNGVEARYVTADVADADDVAAVAGQVAATANHPLVLNLAAVLRDGAIDSVAEEDLGAVLRPKVRGTHAIRQAFRDTDAKIVAFSSTSALLGNAGQAAHAMACAYMDGVAAAETWVSSVQWGPWEDVGITARRGLNDSLRRAGENPAPAAVCLPELTRACENSGVAIAADLRAEALRRHPFLTAMLPPLQLAATGSRQAQSLATEADSPAPDAHIVGWAVANVLGVPADELATDRSLTDNGVDSLSLIEVRSLIERHTGVRVPLNELSDAPTLEAVTAIVEPASAQPAEAPVRAAFYVAGIFGRLDGAPDLEHSLAGRLVTLSAPTRGQGEPGRSDVVEVAKDLAGQVQHIQPVGGLTIVGHSFGAMVAYSLAVELRRRGRTLDRLVLIDGEPVGTKAVATASEQEFAALLEMSGGETSLSADSRASAYEIYRANCEIARSPQVCDELGCPVVIAVPETYLGVGLSQVRAGELAAETQEKLGGTSVDVVRIPGDHFTMLRSPNVTRLAEHIG